MIAKTFVDSNILIYARDADAGSKLQRAAEQLTVLWKSGKGPLSIQVLKEFYVNVTLKIGSPLPASAAREVVRDYAAWVESPITAATISQKIAGIEIVNPFSLPIGCQPPPHRGAGGNPQVVAAETQRGPE